MVVETRFPIMGATGHVVVLGPPHLLAHARARLADLESRWTRFQPTSEISQLNAAAGGPPMRVSTDTFAVVQAAVEAWRLTGGRYDPTVLAALTAAGNDRSFDAIGESAAAAKPRVILVPGCRDLELDPDSSTIRLPRGVSIDLGGIGKGFAADLLAAELRDAGADGVCVNLGGDVRCAGEPPHPQGWVVGIADERAPWRSLAEVGVADGAVATSTTQRRRWRRAGSWWHHLIDPSTGRPSTSDLTTVSVVAGEARWAEVFAKAAFLAGARAGQRLLTDHGLAGLLVDRAGHVVATKNMKDYLLWTTSSGGGSPAPVG